MHTSYSLTLTLSSPLVPCGVGPHHFICSTLSTSHLHPSRPSDILSHSRLFTSDLSRSLATLSFYLNFSLPLLLLPPSSVFHALFVNLSSLILCLFSVSPAHLSPLPATFILRRLFIPISSLNHRPSVISFCFTYTLHLLLTDAQIYSLMIYALCDTVI